MKIKIVEEHADADTLDESTNEFVEACESTMEEERAEHQLIDEVGVELETDDESVIEDEWKKNNKK